MLKTMLEGAALGLSTGTICLLTCTPIYLPWLISEERSIRRSFFKVLEISGGRFFAYLLFGALVGWLGSLVPMQSRTLFTGVSYIFLSVFLGVNALRTHRESKRCQVPGWMKFTHSAFVMGIFSGINFCPSFLIALTKAVELGGAFNGMLHFLGFFFGTSVFLLPLVFSGFLSHLPGLRNAARIVSILIAAYFIVQGGLNLAEGIRQRHKQIINPTDKSYQAIIIFPASDSVYYGMLADSLSLVYDAPPKLIRSRTITPSDLISESQRNILFIAETLWHEQLADELVSCNYVIVPADFTIGRLINFLRTYSFRTAAGKGFHWRFRSEQKN